jgi:hypothetical protein
MLFFTPTLTALALPLPSLPSPLPTKNSVPEITIQFTHLSATSFLLKDALSILSNLRFGQINNKYYHCLSNI